MVAKWGIEPYCSACVDPKYRTHVLVVVVIVAVVEVLPKWQCPYWGMQFQAMGCWPVPFVARDFESEHDYFGG